MVEELRRLGHDVITVAETGNANQKFSDEQVLEFASTSNRAVLTFNRKHFFKLHRDRPIHSGIIACTYDANFVELASRIHNMLVSPIDPAGQLIRINRPR